MKSLFTIFFIAVLVGCQSVEKSNSDENETSSRDFSVTNDSIIYDTVAINGTHYIEITKDQYKGITSLNGDTIIYSEDPIHEINILDINEDGVKDILVQYISTTPLCEIYLFDSTLKTFNKGGT